MTGALTPLGRLWPRSRWRRLLLLAGGALLLYLLALSVLPRLVGRDNEASDRGRGQRAIAAANWSLVLPEERQALARAIDDAWRDLTGYHSRYVSGPPDALQADQPETVSESFIRLDGRRRITAQQDSNLITSRSPTNSTGRDDRFDGYRIRSDQPYLTSTGRKVGQAELVYQRSNGALWTCERSPAETRPNSLPALDLREAGDAGFTEVAGRRARGFVLSAGAFGLRSEATVWVDVETLRVVRQEIASTLAGRREVWTFDRFNEPFVITPPTGVVCRDV